MEGPGERSCGRCQASRWNDSHHAPDCPSYEPPAEFSGLGQVLGSAITEDPATGETTLKLDFPLTKLPGRSQIPPAGGESDRVDSDGTRLSLRGLLHYLWDQAELSRWHPGFAGKRTWGTVRRHLLQSAENKIAKGDMLRFRFYIPEIFSVEHRDAINARRLAQWGHAMPSPGKPLQLMLMIAEVKEIVPARYGYRVVVKHLPDLGFAIDEAMYRRLGLRFAEELAMWAAADDLHMVMIGTFRISSAGVPSINELCLMPVTRQWLPVQDAYEKQLIDRLTKEDRAFVKGLRYNLPATVPVAFATLTDVPGPPLVMTLDVSVSRHDTEGAQPAMSTTATDGSDWVWRVSNSTVPGIPPAVHRPSSGANDESRQQDLTSRRSH